MQALDSFYIGVGLLTTPFKNYDVDEIFGTWKFFQQVRKYNPATGEVFDEKTELNTTSCRAFVDNNYFFEPSDSAKRLLTKKKEVLTNMRCVEKSFMQRLQAQSEEFWVNQPNYSFQFMCDDCQNKTSFQAWRNQTKMIVYYNSQSLNTTEFQSDPIRNNSHFLYIDFDNTAATQATLEVQVDSYSL